MTTQDSPGPIRWQHDDDGIVVLTLDAPGHRANTMTDAFRAALETAVDRLTAERDHIHGVIITSAKTVFFAGGDLRELRRLTREKALARPDIGRHVKQQLRRLETLGQPVVAALNGTALGGGLELALAAHHRIVVDDPAIRLGLPEVTLGLLPGAGGIVRTVRMLGLTTALERVLWPGKPFTPRQARELGLADELVATRGDLLPAARAWIATHPDPRQPWDTHPGPALDPGTAAALPALIANLRKRLAGANYPAPHHILAAAVEGAQVDADTAMDIETRYYLDLATGQVAKNMIQAQFFDTRRVRGPRARPDTLAPFTPARAVVLGAGMMGAGIAYSLAHAGLHVVLTDTSTTLAGQGKQRIARLVTDATTTGRMTARDGERLLARITPTADSADAAGAQLVIEAVIEDPATKTAALAAVEPHLAPGALLASNTSTLPITGLAANMSTPQSFLGMHFFSPVPKMPLVELITGARTSPDTLHRALDVVRQLNKTAIVVHDSPGFFTSRVIRTFNDEGLRMLAEGVPAASIEQACRQAGYPTPVLQLSDELNLTMMRRIRSVNRAADTEPGIAEHVIIRMLDEHQRAGRHAGAGFYDYTDGRRTRLWPGLRGLSATYPAQVPFPDLIERLLFIEALEAVRCLDEHVIDTVADANIGSLLGIGYPRWTGGVLQYINGYREGPRGFTERARQLAATYGDRFQPPQSLLTLAGHDGHYTDEPTQDAGHEAA